MSYTEDWLLAQKIHDDAKKKSIEINGCLPTELRYKIYHILCFLKHMHPNVYQSVVKDLEQT